MIERNFIMGLDMYLNAKRFFWNDEADLTETIAKLFPELQDGKQVREIVVEAIYWRKVNSIHNWFVENVQGGTDDCGSYEVTLDQLIKLRDLILEVLKTRDSSKLPPKPGFFFGSTDIDEYYFDDLEYTLSSINRVLEDFNNGSWTFFYESSW